MLQNLLIYKAWPRLTTQLHRNTLGFLERIYWTTNNRLMDSLCWQMVLWFCSGSYLWVPANQGLRIEPSLPFTCACSEGAKFLSGWRMGCAKDDKTDRFETRSAVLAVLEESRGDSAWAVPVSFSLGAIANTTVLRAWQEQLQVSHFFLRLFLSLLSKTGEREMTLIWYSCSTATGY